MTYWLRVYQATLKTSIAQMLQYRFGILIWAVWGFVGPLISLAVWSAATSSRGKPISGGGMEFSQRDFAAYFLVYMVVGHLIMSWDAFEFAWRVRDGNLSPRLLKPVLPIHSDLCANIAFKLTTMAMILPAWIALFLMLHPSPPKSPVQFLLGIPAVILAGLIRYIWQYSLALCAFWTTRVEAINEFYFALDSFLAGRIAPLALLPAWMATAAYFSPFRSMGGFPVELILGRLSPAQIASGFAFQIMWLAIGAVVFRLMWAGGIRQYSAVGA